MINGPTAPKRPAPHRSRPVALSVLTALLLFGGGMIVAGLLERPAEPSWATGETAGDTARTPTIMATGPSGTTAARTPSASATLTAARSRKPSSRKRAKTAATTAPAGRPATVTPTSSPSASAKPTPSPSPSPSLPVVTLGSKCTQEGARAVSRLGLPVICARRSWDDTLRWRLA